MTMGRSRGCRREGARGSERVLEKGWRRGALAPGEMILEARSGLLARLLAGVLHVVEPVLISTLASSGGLASRAAASGNPRTPSRQLRRGLPCSQMLEPRTPAPAAASPRGGRCSLPRHPCTWRRLRACRSERSGDAAALGSHPPVLAARVPALAPASHPPALADALAPPHSLHRLRCLPCSQMPERRTPCTCIEASEGIADAPGPDGALHACFAASRARRCSRPRTPWRRFGMRAHARRDARALLALGSLPPVLADPLPRHSLHKYPRLALPCGHVGPLVPFASRARSLAKIREHGVVSCVERCDLRRTERGSDERSVFSEAFGTTNRRDLTVQVPIRAPVAVLIVRSLRFSSARRGAADTAHRAPRPLVARSRARPGCTAPPPRGFRWRRRRLAPRSRSRLAVLARPRVGAATARPAATRPRPPPPRRGRVRGPVPGVPFFALSDADRASVSARTRTPSRTPRSARTRSSSP